ncbi:MAG: RnfABCDGE type electron transport complex subunit D [Firmicutes bacterium]|nr:RnfABCDGE type electron transport complex subunit D [Dethiobacter sp.]MBS3888045.1 RnfABCDGE type electron transport complex subunit D [Bacillota bacterium]MBS4055203.1 RnfABCDGE type electron transport complex subunit D [Thermaerobacter sp.]
MKMMREMLTALVPVTLAALWFFRWPALFLLVVSVGAAVATEALWQTARKQPLKIKDLSAVVTGLLFGLSLSPSLPLYIAIVGSVFAVVVGKLLWGGFGKNLFNPALLGRLFIVLAFPGTMRPWLAPVDLVTTATPLQIFRADGAMASLVDLFTGQVAGSIGETSVVALLLGFAWLHHKKFANWRIPAGGALAVAALSVVAGQNPLFHLLSGSLLLGLFFMATDPVTSPRTQVGRWAFGAAIGVGIMAMRFFSPLPEGTTFAILGLNAAVPLINRYTMPAKKSAPVPAKAKPTEGV